MKFKKLILCTIIFTIIMLILITFLPNFELNNKIGLVNNSYDPDIKVYNYFYDLSDKIVVKSDVDVNKVGKYNISCKIKYLFFNIKKNFTVEIIDNEKPLIELTGNNIATVCPNKEYVEEGYTAYDNYDGDITDKVNIKKNNDSISYSVIDSSNNKFEIERKIIYEDKEEPIITLKGEETITLYLGNKFTDPGYTANDNCDGDITDKVIVNGDVDTNKIGNYTIKYEVTDSNGNLVSISRNINVKKKIGTYGNGKIYLTFDDGSSYLTNQILDILKEENIKATFFVANVTEYTKRAYNEGHTIGLHSNTHNYAYIYSSSDNYFNDLYAISDKVYNYIGVRSKIIRFPGGSSNTISRNYNKGIMSYLTNEVLNRGYTYFDWNVDSNDAGSDIYNSNNIYYNVVNNLSHSKTNVVLMHDSASHTATVEALRSIISYGKEYGYSFENITDSTPIVIHKVNN